MVDNKIEISFQIYFLLRKKNIVSATEMAAELGVSARTIKRYIERLYSVIPIISFRGRYGGFALADYEMKKTYSEGYKDGYERAIEDLSSEFYIIHEKRRLKA